MYTLWGVYPGTKRCCYGHTRVGTRLHSLLNIPYSGRYPDTTGVYLSTPLLRYASLSRGEACWLFYFVHGRVVVYEAFFSLSRLIAQYCRVAFAAGVASRTFLGRRNRCRLVWIR
ncbi:unnamed protein product [Laminaria digitata]